MLCLGAGGSGPSPTSLKLTPRSAKGSSVRRAAVLRSTAMAARSISSPSCRGSALVSAGPVYLRRCIFINCL